MNVDKYTFRLLPKPITSWAVTHDWLRRHQQQHMVWHGVGTFPPVVASIMFLDVEDPISKRLDPQQDCTICICNHLTDQYFAWTEKIIVGLGSEHIAQKIQSLLDYALPVYQIIQDAVDMEAT